MDCSLVVGCKCMIIHNRYQAQGGLSAIRNPNGKQILTALAVVNLILFLAPEVGANKQELKPQEVDSVRIVMARVEQSKPWITNKRSKKQTAVSHRRRYSTQEVQDLIIKYSYQYGIDPALPLRISFCESRHRWNAENKTSSASGTFQYVQGTWANTPEGKKGLSVFDADANVRAAVRHISVHGTSPWSESRTCWQKTQFARSSTVDSAFYRKRSLLP